AYISFGEIYQAQIWAVGQSASTISPGAHFVHHIDYSRIINISDPPHIARSRPLSAQVVNEAMTAQIVGQAFIARIHPLASVPYPFNFIAAADHIVPHKAVSKVVQGSFVPRTTSGSDPARINIQNAAITIVH
ncbi:MAG: hypothetical protein ACE5EZ_06625, partial [Thermodesulfobacteriota bacterium]